MRNCHKECMGSRLLQGFGRDAAECSALSVWRAEGTRAGAPERQEVGSLAGARGPLMGCRLAIGRVMRVNEQSTVGEFRMITRKAPSRKTLGLGMLAALLLVSGCGWGGNRAGRQPVATPSAEGIRADLNAERGNKGRSASSIFDIFKPRGDQGQVGSVNKYIWNASLEVLNFLPIETVDPFSGVITTGFGTPPGGGTAYRATILVNDPALDARSLNLALMTRGGPASASTVRAIEDAILTRARQLRAQDSRL